MDQMHTRLSKSFREHCITKAKQGQQKDVWLSLSGGIDSHFVAVILKEAGVKFRAATNVFKNELNDFDVFWARKICQELDIELFEFDLDVEKFFENELMDYDEK